MEISVREAATLLGRSRRTVRAQLARGDLAGRKRQGRWRVDRRHLPLTEAQHQALQRKADDVRQAVEAALPSRLSRDGGDRSRSVLDLDAFRIGAEVLGEVRKDGSGLAEERQARIAAALEQGLLALTEATLHFDRGRKQEALHRCRGHLAEALGLLLLAPGSAPGQPVAEWSRRLEKEMAPALAGFARWVDRLRERRP